MTTIGWHQGDNGIVLYRRDFAEYGLAQDADITGEHFYEHRTLGMMKSCRWCSALVGGDAIVFWQHPRMFGFDEDDFESELCLACKPRGPAYDRPVL